MRADAGVRRGRQVNRKITEGERLTLRENLEIARRRMREAAVNVRCNPGDMVWVQAMLGRWAELEIASADYERALS